MCGLYFCETVRFFVGRNFVNGRTGQGYNIHAVWSKCDVCHPFMMIRERELDPSSSKGILPMNIIPLRLVSFEIINVPKGCAPDSSIFGTDHMADVSLIYLFRKSLVEILPVLHFAVCKPYACIAIRQDAQRRWGRAFDDTIVEVADMIGRRQ